MVTTEQLEALAVELFNIGAVQFGAFKLKLHETNPDAELSPIYFNLGAKREGYRGTLDAILLERVCYLLSVELQGKGVEYTHVCGVPQAGDPYADWLANPPMSGSRKKGVIRLTKRTNGDGTRSIVGIEDGAFAQGDRVLLVDDLITKAGSKLEAIYELEKAGLVVKDVAVVVDRCQGGTDSLAEYGYTTHALYELPILLGFLRTNALIDDDMVQKVIDYLARSV